MRLTKFILIGFMSLAIVISAGQNNKAHALGIDLGGFSFDLGGSLGGFDLGSLGLGGFDLGSLGLGGLGLGGFDLGGSLGGFDFGGTLDGLLDIGSFADSLGFGSIADSLGLDGITDLASLDSLLTPENIVSSLADSAIASGMSLLGGSSTISSDAVLSALTGGTFSGGTGSITSAFPTTLVVPSSSSGPGAPIIITPMQVNAAGVIINPGSSSAATDFNTGMFVTRAYNIRESYTDAFERRGEVVGTLTEYYAETLASP